MLRKTLTILSLIGLLLSVGLWGASLIFSFGYLFRYCGIAFEHSAVQFAYFDSKPLDEIGGYCESGSMSLTLLPFFRRFNKSDWMIAVPFWLPILICGFIFWFSWRPAYRRRKRKKLGLCLKCGYDLRASKDRCPECGETK